MAHPLSTLGIIHTVLSLPPVVAGIYCFVRDGRIVPATRAGKIYLLGLTVSVLTSFGLSSTGGFNPGHALGLLALLAAYGGALIQRMSIFGRLTSYLSALGLSFSFFLLLVPGINETLSRLPPSHPLANGIESPVVRGALLAWIVIFIVGATVQIWYVRSRQQRT
jgi:hypothetical protein